MNIVFIQPDSFLRTKKHTNPFFDPIVDVIKSRIKGAEWSIWLPKKILCGYPEGKVRSYALFQFYVTWARRISRVLCPWTNAGRLYEFLVRIALPFCREWKKADIFITITNIFSTELFAMFPKKCVVDIQHGVIYSNHRGYFCKNGVIIPAHQRYTNREYWVYGQGYADCFFKNSENHKWLDGRVKVIGDVVRAGARVESVEKVEKVERRLVVFSLQLTDDLDAEEKAASVVAMEKFFSEFFARFGNRYECLVKHHPRFNNCFDLSAFYQKFPQVKESKAPWPELYPKMALHVTFSSTVSFDCASAGVPTCLPSFEGAKILDNAFYHSDYGYPYCGKNAEETLAIPFEEASKKVHDWYLRFYTPFSEENCLKLLKGVERVVGVASVEKVERV